MLSKRLLAAAKYLKGFNYLADCGTDHGYLPIYAIKSGLIKKAIASDNKKYPLENARKNINLHSLNIKTVLADGLPYLDQEIDVISVLGMGGKLIKEILESANLTYVKRIILAPNSDAFTLRTFLQEINFKIISEEIIKEKDKFYQIIICEPGEMRLNELEKEFGPFIIAEKSSTFVELIQKLVTKLEVGILEVKNNSNYQFLKNRIEKLKELIR